MIRFAPQTAQRVATPAPKAPAADPSTLTAAPEATGPADGVMLLAELPTAPAPDKAKAKTRTPRKPKTGSEATAEQLALEA